MSNTEIQEGNKLIAEFMGGYVQIGKTTKKSMYSFLNNIEFCEALLPQTKDGNYLFFEAQLLFHSSWDWLMPVAQKILRTETGTLDVYSLYVSDALRTADISKIYESVIDFIQWYNQHKNP